ncbi:3-deoxy-7-phosphoheptulonate synthase AroG [Pasteurellaceae bacterium HPA106]|uniref:3-deoxy-7-phosphoheptulonate synthase AroG n=1 Tax=Spirabiliibacterium pneumoniae TaxID=221400 RepID=UPI001AAD7051|nr:3-deoxy-7-phosphoheptulonate synthase AroG [Spirabiliibacterium pneumoniae]MBE2895425.1 3-deoxy-7-phosphoheptulonate synthase AroG [Spirabiliibacterium pneumoniae]
MNSKNKLYYKNDDLRIEKTQQLLPPVALLEKYPASDIAAETVAQAREKAHNIIHGKDDRLLVIIGPCSIHDPTAALEYAQKIKAVRAELGNELEIIMRVYFEKPRTTVGWKGFINDPYLNDSFLINDGLRMARKVLSDINDMQVPAAGEFLDMITPQYMADFMSWGAIGARTTESQVHRELASGLSCGVGFKNATNGCVQVALDAIGAAQAPHNFLSVTKFGHSAIVTTKGNEDCHIILRGGDKQTNYDADSVEQVCERLAEKGKVAHVMIDFSHANSQKQFKKQLDVCHDVCEQIANGSYHIFGVMIESHLVEGRQNLVDGKALVYGQSITDSCLGWEDSEKALCDLAQAVRSRRAKKS